MSDVYGGDDDDDGDQDAAPVTDGSTDNSGYAPLDGSVNLTPPGSETFGSDAAKFQWNPAPQDGSVDLTPAPAQGLFGSFKALPFDGESERWLYHPPGTGSLTDDGNDAAPSILSRPIDLIGGRSDDYLQALGPSLYGPPPGPRILGPASGEDGQADATAYPAAQSITRVATNASKAEIEALRNQLLAPGAEGYRRDVYDDGFGNLTTGIGHKVVPTDGLQKGQVVSAQQVEQFYQTDAAKALNAAHQQAAEAGITDPNFIPHLADVNFQLGTGWRDKFKNAWSAMKSGNYKVASDEIAKGKNGGPSLWYSRSRQRVSNFQAALGALPPKPPNQ